MTFPKEELQQALDNLQEKITGAASALGSNDELQAQLGTASAATSQLQDALQSETTSEEQAG